MIRMAINGCMYTIDNIYKFFFFFFLLEKRDAMSTGTNDNECYDSANKTELIRPTEGCTALSLPVWLSRTNTYDCSRKSLSRRI